MQAASDVSARKDFYQKLLWNDLFVLSGDQSNPLENEASGDQVTVRLVSFENGFIPVFTSANRIFDKGIIKHEVAYMTFRGQDLFDFARGKSFVLNPYSDVGKELHPEEIEHMMDGTIYDRIDEYETELQQHQEFNAIYERATNRQKGLIFLEGYRNTRLRKSDILKIEESITDFKKCLELIPNHWPSMLMMAKSFQRLEKHSEALELLETAFKLELENHSIAMEASIEAMNLRDIDKALFYSEAAMKRKPNDHILMGNHAMNLLIAKKDEEAVATIEKAVELQPNDSVNKKNETFVKAVVAGIRQRPAV